MLIYISKYKTKNMAEQLVLNPEAPVGSEIVELHDELFELPVNGVLYDLDDTRFNSGINATTVAEIILPTPADNASDYPKTLLLVDFGTDIPKGGVPILFNKETGDEIDTLGTIHTRFALMGKGYKIKGAMLAFLPLKDGKSVTLGKEDNRTNYILGLSEDGNATISRQHATITVEKTGRVYIEDHSTNGTWLVIPTDK
jgi:hypothetical protein